MGSGYPGAIMDGGRSAGGDTRHQVLPHKPLWRFSSGSGDNQPQDPAGLPGQGGRPHCFEMKPAPVPKERRSQPTQTGVNSIEMERSFCGIFRLEGGDGIASFFTRPAKKPQRKRYPLYIEEDYGLAEFVP